MTRGGQVIWETLRHLGARHVFGLPGAQMVPLIDELRRTDLTTVLTTSELSAAFAANGYYRASGRPAVLATIPGPGFTIALTGLAEACHDSVGMIYLVFEGAGPTTRPYALQAIDQSAVAKPLVKDILTLDNPDHIGEVIAGAWSLATSAEPGPVIVSIRPGLVAESAATARAEPTPIVPEPDPDQITQLMRRLANSRYPVIFAGGGSLDAAEDVVRLAEHMDAPVVTTVSGRGVIPENHPLALPFDFSAGAWRTFDDLLQESDCVLMIGCKMTHNGSAGFNLRLPEKKLIRIDSSAEVLAAGYPASLSIEADAQHTLTALLSAIVPGSAMVVEWQPEKIKDHRRRMREEVRAKVQHLPTLSGNDTPNPAHFFDILRDVCPDDTIVCTDSGNHQIVTRAYWQVRRPRTFVVPSDFQSMGYGIPAAIGAKLARRDQPVIAVVGDGSMAMSGMELLAAVREGLRLTVLILNDGHLGQIRHQQIGFSGREHAVKLHNPDFGKFAESIGANYMPLIDETEACLREALAMDGVTIVEAVLSDSPETASRIRRSIVKSELKRLAPTGLVSSLKKLLGR